jgi:hypothetical protein
MTKLSVAVGLTLASALPGVSGTIRGVVTVQIPEVPAARALSLNTDPDCLAMHTEPLMSESHVVDADKNVMNAFVYVQSGLGEQTFRPPRKPAVLDQIGCVYLPHVMGIMVGQPLTILNSDGIMHNVHSTPEANTEFNKAMPAMRKKMTVPGKIFAQPEVMVPFKCDVHPWMAAYVGVLPHPFFAVSAADGSFEIGDLPAGSYVVEVWHELFQSQTREVVVGDAEVTADFALLPPSAN